MCISSMVYYGFVHMVSNYTFGMKVLLMIILKKKIYIFCILNDFLHSIATILFTRLSINCIFMLIVFTYK